MIVKHAPILKKYSRFFSFSLFSTDMLVIAFSWALAFVLVTSGEVLRGEFDHVHVPSSHIWLLPIVVAVFAFFFQILNVYTPRRYRSMYAEQTALAKAVAISSLIVGLAYIGFVDNGVAGKVFSLAFWLSVTCGLLLFRSAIRIFLRSIRRRGYNLRHVVIVGAGKNGREILSEIRSNPWLGVVVYGFVDSGYEKGQRIDGVEVVGGFGDLKSLVRLHAIDQVYITLPTKQFDLIEKIAESLLQEVVSIRIVPEFFAKPAFKEINLETFSDIPVFTVNQHPLEDRVGAFLKRASDVLFSTLFIVALSPLMLLIAAGVKLTSQGPVFFRQERIGLNGKKFVMYKFRTMRVSTITEAEELKRAEKLSDMFTKVNDPRKTSFGSFLRKTSIDELPQFLNVLTGDMSIVGPRPERPLIVEQLKYEIPQYAQRHKIKAGITGWAQVNGWRGNTCLEKRVEHDLYYIKNWSVTFDLKIMLLTFFRGFINKNAY